MTKNEFSDGEYMPYIYEILHSLGVTANYTGFFQTSYAVYLAVKRPESLLMVTKWLYPEVARHFNTTWRSVERNIRTVLSIVWDLGRVRLEELAHCTLTRKPTASKFLAILSSAIAAGYESR